MVTWMIRHEGPVYLRICRNDLPEVTGDHPDPVAPAVLREGSDAALVACGVMTARALQAADLLSEKGISARVINVPCLKPFPEEAVRDLLTGVQAIVSCEEHSVIGGLSQALSWALRGDGRPLEAVAVQDEFGQSAASYEELLEHYRLTAGDIAERTMKTTGPA